MQSPLSEEKMSNMDRRRVSRRQLLAGSVLAIGGAAALYVRHLLTPPELESAEGERMMRFEDLADGETLVGQLLLTQHLQGPLHVSRIVATPRLQIEIDYRRFLIQNVFAGVPATNFVTSITYAAATREVRLHSDGRMLVVSGDAFVSCNEYAYAIDIMASSTDPSFNVYVANRSSITGARQNVHKLECRRVD